MIGSEAFSKFMELSLKISERYGERALSTFTLNKHGWTALHAACYFGRVEMVHYLI
jgi:ankyrin repeat protein